MGEWECVALCIFLLVVSIYPTQYEKAIAISREMLVIKTMINFSYNIIALFFYLAFFSDYSITFLSIHGSLVVSIILVETIIFEWKYKKLLIERIKSIPNYLNLTKGQIRNEIIRLYDEAFDIKSIEKALKKLGYFD